MTLLEVNDVDVRYGDFQAVFGVSLAVDEGETLAIVGANGAGKSTLLKAIAGLMRPSAGDIRFGGASVTRQAAHRRVAMGISLTPEGRRVFASLTIEENLLVGAYTGRPGPWDLPAVYELFPFLQERRTRLGAVCSGGEQQATAIGRSLMGNPRLLLLDEVSLGLAPAVVEQLYAALSRVRDSGTTILLVEQDVGRALSVADRVQCLLEGRTVLSGRADSVSRADVASAYFGVS